MKIFKTKKSKIIISSLISVGALSAVCIPICVDQVIINKQHNNIANLHTYKFKVINDKFITDINTLEKLNYLLDNANSSTIVDHFNNDASLPEGFQILDVAFKLSDNSNQLNGSNVKIDYDLTYDNLNDNSSSITESFKNISIGLQIIDFSSTNFRMKIKDMNSMQFDQLFSQDNVKNTVFNLNVGINEDNTKNIIVRDSYNNDSEHYSKMNMDINIQLQDGYVYNESFGTTNKMPFFTTDINVKKIKTKFSNYKVNQSNLINEINSLKGVSYVNSILRTQDQGNNMNLDSFVANSEFISNNELILNNTARIIGLDDNGNILLEIITTLFGGEQIVTRANTGITAIKLNVDTFKANFKQNINNSNQLNQSHSSIINETNSLFTVNKNNQATSTNAPIDAISSSSEIEYENNIRDDIYWLKKYNCSIILNDGYCFYNAETNSIINSENIENVLSGIIVNTNVSLTLIDSLKDNLKNSMTIENYTTYFNGANKYPEEHNPGRMTEEKIKEISNGAINSEICESWSFNRSTDDISGPYLKLNLTLNFKEPYTYQGESSYTFKNLETKTYDPNSTYNLDMYNWNGDEITGIRFSEYANSVQYTNNIIYLPYKVQSLNLYQSGDRGAIEPGQNGWSKDYRIDKLDATFAMNLVYLKGHRGFFRANINHFDFSGLPNLIGSQYGERRGKESTYYFAESKGYTYNFNDCPKLKYLGTLGWFKSCIYNIQWLSFINCPKLEYLPQDVFNGYSAVPPSSIPHVDLRGTTITWCDQSAFYNCGYKIEAWINNDSSYNCITYAQNSTVRVRWK